MRHENTPGEKLEDPNVEDAFRILGPCQNARFSFQFNAYSASTFYGFIRPLRENTFSASH